MDVPQPGAICDERDGSDALDRAPVLQLDAVLEREDGERQISRSTCVERTPVDLERPDRAQLRAEVMGRVAPPVAFVPTRLDDG